MNAFGKLSKTALIGLSLTLAACAGSVSDTDAVKSADQNKASAERATIKPGAAIRYQSEIDGPLKVGSFTDVEITLITGDRFGTLQATASGTPGLEVLQSSASLNHDMSTGKAVWRVAVRPLDDGKHYLNIMAITFGGGLREEKARAFSIPIDLGGEMRADESQKTTLIESESGQLIIMDAEETVGPNE